MRHVALNATVLAVACVAFLTVAAAVSGYLYGAGANHQHPPGVQGALVNTFAMTVFYGPAAGLIGGIAGAGAGLVRALIEAGRDRRTG
jgi:hypothetical protein